MNNLIEVYTKLKLYIGSKIKITYLTNDNIIHTKEATLLDIYDLSSIYLEIDNELKSIPFISQNIIIKNIYLPNHNTPIYNNQYIENNQNPFLNYKEIRNKIFNQSIIDENTLNEINDKINTYLARYETVTYNNLFFSTKQKEEFEQFFKLLVKELSKYAKDNNLNPTLKKISAGTTSIIYEIGDKIIKIGKPRRMPTIPYCEFILQPIVNRIFEFDGYPIHIEVTEKVIPLVKSIESTINNPNYKNIYKIMDIIEENLQQIGLVAKDLHPANIGILIKDNQIHYKDSFYKTSPEESTSITNNNHYKILPKNSFVIIDLDSIEIEDQEKYRTYLENLFKQPTNTLSKKREIQ